jgi:2-polyprenyl-3-methyl-5-hydroxy-6-metoxy-1,4-benzoquinol methylase
VGLVTGASLPESHFDAVSMNHVIEHLHDPVATLKECRRIMKPGGTISIATPNLASAGHKLFGPDWFALDPPRHLVLFTPDSLRRALRTAGFEPEPVLRSKESARAIIRRSIHIQEGNDPMREKPGLSLMNRLKARRLARQADQQSRAQPEVEEELVLLARKPWPPRGL